jgi:FkbM family methyltransferase
MVQAEGLSLSVRQLRRWGRRVFDTFFCSLEPGVMTFGKDSSWHVHAGLIDRSSCVVSAGVGKDITFEKELVARFGCPVLLLDPSPTGALTMQQSENRVAEIEFLPLGLTGTDGEREFALPADPTEGSFTAVKSGAGDRTSFTCRSLSSLTRERGIERIDLLKLDIEGFEYEVLDDVLASGLPVTQLCVEFHHFMPGIGIGRTVTAIGRLYRAGFRLLHKSGTDYTFVRPNANRPVQAS